ncbi:MAG: putative ABC exporter domain-containing protein [Oscillospiraceae bacterium]
MNGNALGFILRTKIKNKIKSFFKKPIRIIYVLIFAALFAVTIAGGASGEADSDRTIRDISELMAGLKALLILIFSITFYSGFQKGGSLFSMADVNMIFSSPINKRSVLFYGLVQQMGTSLFIGVFILYQYAMLHVYYNISVLGLLLIFLVYSLTVFFSQTCAMFVYCFTSDSNKKSRTVKLVFFAVLALMAAYVGLNLLQSKDNILASIVSSINGLPITIFPFAGWLGAFGGAILSGNYISAAIWLLPTVVVFIAMLIAMSKADIDFYEDVLASAENTQTALSAAREGAAPEAIPHNIRVGKPGIGKGLGASVIFFKHMLESRRSGRFFISGISLSFAVMTIVFSLFAKKAGLIGVFAFYAYLEIFSTTNGRFNRELLKPYIYLIPEPPLKKMMFSLMETLPSAFVQSAVAFVPCAIIVGASAVECVCAILGGVSFAALFVASNVLVERIWGGSLSKTLGILIYCFAGILLAAPGVALALVLNLSGAVLINYSVTAFLAMTLCNIPVALLVLFLCRNMLQYAET